MDNNESENLHENVIAEYATENDDCTSNYLQIPNHLREEFLKLSNEEKIKLNQNTRKKKYCHSGI